MKKKGERERNERGEKVPCVRHLAVLTAQHLACFSYAFVEAPYAASLISFSRIRA